MKAVNSKEELEELKSDHDVLFLLVHDGTVDNDWQAAYMKVHTYIKIYMYLHPPDPGSRQEVVYNTLTHDVKYVILSL